MDKRVKEITSEVSAFLVISLLVSIGGLLGVTAVGAEAGVVDDPDQCPPNMDIIGTNCHMVSEETFTKQSDAKAFCQNQTWEQRNGHLFTPTTIEHAKAAHAFVVEQKGRAVRYVWTDWIKDPVTRKVISPSNPHIQWPTEPTLWKTNGREPGSPLESASSIVGGKYLEPCIAMEKIGAIDCDCEPQIWVRYNTPVYALCEFF